MNYPVILFILIILSAWIGLAKLFKYWGFMKEDREILEEFKNKK